ncbi:MAG TPA: DUF4010 domain-containing protein, partial [Bacteroidia bacterium]|nr:DUF4010 domain-containing protein [Bacteroidia bacterium]
VSAGVVFVLFLKKNSSQFPVKDQPVIQKNPLEFRVALAFAVFYIIFSLLLQVTENRYGTSGLNFLSFIAGFADVDAYVMNIVQGKFSVSELTMVAFILKTSFSNNLIKMLYSFGLAEKKTKKSVAIGFGIILLVNLLLILKLQFIS